MTSEESGRARDREKALGKWLMDVGTTDMRAKRKDGAP